MLLKTETNQNMFDKDMKRKRLSMKRNLVMKVKRMNQAIKIARVKVKKYKTEEVKCYQILNLKHPI